MSRPEAETAPMPEIATDVAPSDINSRLLAAFRGLGRLAKRVRRVFGDEGGQRIDRAEDFAALFSVLDRQTKIALKEDDDLDCIKESSPSPSPKIGSSSPISSG